MNHLLDGDARSAAAGIGSEKTEARRTGPTRAFGIWPVIGIGKGSFPTSGATHNFYVRLLSDVGLVGTTLFAWILLSIGRIVFGLYRSPPHQTYRWVAASWLLVTVFMGIANLFGEYLLTVRPAETY